MKAALKEASESLLTASIALSAASLVLGTDVAATYAGPVDVRTLAKHYEELAASARKASHAAMAASKEGAPT